MEKKLGIRLLLLGLTVFVFTGVKAQLGDFESIISNGVAEYELGNYEGAQGFFRQAYKFNKKSNIACYELALTYLALNKNVDAAELSGKIISRGGEYVEDAYLINGSAWENLKREQKSRRIYKEGIKKYPNNHLMHYNLALSYFNAKEYDEAQEQAIDAIEIYPSHASSHLLLAYIMFNKGARVQSMLPLYYFLLIEQDSERSATAYDLLSALWNQGVGGEGQRNIKLVKAGYGYSEFGSAELAISLMKAAEQSKKSGNWEETNKHLMNFANNNKALFKILEESAIDKNGFWWEFYVKFFTKLEKNNLSEPYSYFISSCKHNKDVLLWLSDHHKDFQRFTAWMELN